ncbi:MAG TPA: ROK family transcriptional regulator [Trebonia sp.]|nr:ROK family transcriptional regulator [Trebonia sp.]
MSAGGVRPRPLRPIGKLLAEDTKRHHRSLILQQLFAEGPASRADLARATGLTRGTVSDLVGGLIADGLLGELGVPAASRVGKPPTLVGLLADAAHIVALDLSPDDRVTGAVVNLFGQVRSRAEVPLDGACGEEAVHVAVGLAEKLRATIDRPVLGVGVGSPGVVDGRGVILDAHNLHWAGVDLTGIIRRRLDLPVYVANDASTAVLAEYTFGGTTAADLMLLRIGTGVGAGLVVGGALVQGHAWAAGEIGHVVVDPAGARCACGKAGCLETILSVPHLRQRLRHGDRSLASVGVVLGAVLAPVVAALNLHEVVLAGPPDLLDGELRQALDGCVRDRVMTTSSADLVVRMSPLGDDVVLVGAAVLVLSGELGVS